MNSNQGASSRSVRCQGAIVKDGQILLIQHREHESGRSYWVFPGGGQEAGEGEEECVRREMLEETGLSVRVERLLLDLPEPPGGAYQRHHTYLCRPLSGDARPGHEPEFDAAQRYGIVAVKWFDLQDENSWGDEVRSDRFTYPEMKAVQQILGFS